MKPEDRVRLKHISDACREALSFVEGKSLRDMDTDRMLVLALIKEVEIIGEAASRISDETRKSLKENPWGPITAMRNRLIHAYFDIDLDVLWQTVSEDLPALLEQLRNI